MVFGRTHFRVFELQNTSCVDRFPWVQCSDLRIAGVVMRAVVLWVALIENVDFIDCIDWGRWFAS